MTRKKLGIVSFFPAFSPPRSGGELRYWNLATRLSRTFEVEMVDPTYGEASRERVEHTPTCSELRIPKNRRYNALHHFLDRHARFRECSGLVCSLAGPWHPELRSECRRLAQSSDVLIHTSPFLWSLAKRARPRQLLVYDAYNVESVMARDMFGTHGMWGRLAVQRIESLERSLVREADLVLACSEEDIAEFGRRYGADLSKFLLVPNGVDVDAVRPAPSPARREEARRKLRLDPNRPAAFFIGSFHPPNIEAVEFLLSRVVPVMGGVDFLVAGNVCKALMESSLPRNVRLLGQISEETKSHLFHGTDVALNPMISGSGTNLKMLDYLASGLPVVTTVRGARGLGLRHQRHAMVVDEARFLEGVEDVLADSQMARRLGREARALTESSFSWEVIADSVRDAVRLKLSPRVIVLNDFPVTPADSGGRARVEALGRQIAASHPAVTILTLCSEQAGRMVQLGPGLEELNVPRSTLHRGMDALLSHFAGVGADDLSALRFAWLTPAFARALRREARFGRALVLSHPYMTPCARPYRGRMVVFHDSHNVEAELKRQIYHKTWIGRWMRNAVAAGEQEAVRMSKVTSCVSLENLESLRQVGEGNGRRLILAPNGVDCSRLQPISHEDRRRLRRAAGFSDEPVAIFLASGHPPNAEAARQIIEHIAPRLPEVTFLLVGSVCGWFVGQPMPANLMLVGVVSQGVKDFLLQTSTVALNPMLQGSGTNLKALDYLSAGLALITTPVGARGIASADSADMIVCPAEQMAAELKGLLADPPRLEELGRRGRQLAEQKFDWTICLKEFVELLGEYIDKGQKGNT